LNIASAPPFDPAFVLPAAEPDPDAPAELPLSDEAAPAAPDDGAAPEPALAPADPLLDGLSWASPVSGRANAAATAAAISVFSFMVISLG
jgi:hypothetical protein